MPNKVLISCPSCSRKLRCNVRLLDKKVICKGCGRHFDANIESHAEAIQLLKRASELCKDAEVRLLLEQ